ncbi:FMN-binding protein [Rhodococcus sp. Leaf7]|uniref:FMN-binding protein n=1 Tax=unclassified Rhodococcus (in: high G+C Gram-positive bacteria) TaxID=192944 RepID=UPI0006FFAB22|nr:MULTISPECIES: FMN-binding protein [unclassified Rhodococcus (in: high G+C Gram-positive bacteria)]KQU06674.1 FMN-binding protein [Rhodococcus sp. Leaf7]KQU42194.1 FMN-binding protein [Rhodococcus sp. Leaf247]
MRRISWWFASTVTAVVLAFSYHTSTGTTPMTAVVATAAPTGTAATETAVPTAIESNTTAAQTFTGESVDTRWGPVQVRITVTDGSLSDATAIVYPTANGKDQQINARALPVLGSEAVAAQSASIDMVSGATVTSEGYIQSLQSALDQAHLA